jgi:hypothetical protein
LEYLTQGGYKLNLEDLAVSDNAITNRGLSKLSKVFDTLHCFSAGGNSLNDESMDVLNNNLNM